VLSCPDFCAGNIALSVKAAEPLPFAGMVMSPSGTSWCNSK